MRSFLRFASTRTMSAQGLKSGSLSPSPQERRSAQARARIQTVAALTGATPPVCKGSKKPSVCQGQAARGAVASQTLTACQFLQRADCGGVEGNMRRMYTLSIHPPSARPQGREHGSQDNGAAFRPLQALHATTQKQIFCIIRGIIVACGGRGFSPEPTPNYKLREPVLKSVYGFTPYKIIRVFVQ